MTPRTRLYSISWAVLCMASAANAQVAPAPSPAATAEPAADRGLEEIVVTAQRRAEAAQSVPISVAAFNEDQLAKVGLATSSDLASVIPGLSVNPSGPRSPLFLRGVGNNGTSTSPSVLAFIDGVYLPFDATGSEYSNVKSIELAKGPQGTLFGRNATGGVIQITTKDPFAWQGLDAQVGYANYRTASSKIYGSAKLSDQVATDIAGFYERQSDGWGTNYANGKPSMTSNRHGVRNKWVAQLDDSFKATFSIDYEYRWGQAGLTVSPSNATGFLFNPVTAQRVYLPSIYDTISDDNPAYRTREGGAALTLDKSFGDIRLLSITSWRREVELLDIDFDGSQFPGIALSRRDDRSVVTQELQLSGGESRLHWVTGLYYFRMDDGINGPRFAGLFVPPAFGTPPGVPFAISSDDTTNAYAAYAQATAEILPATNLTLGARYTLEDREIIGRTTGSLFLSPGSAGTEAATFKKPNFRFALDHKITPDILAYASYNRGFNAGFFNQIAVGGFNEQANPVVKPEVIDAYETGLKSDWLEHHLRVNVAGFFYNYSNLQQQIYRFGGIFSLNAARAQIKGVDLEIVALPLRNLTLSVSANYLDAKYKSYPEAVDYTVDPASGAFLAPGSLDAKGKQLVQAPKDGVQATATYTLDTVVGPFDSTVNVNYQALQYGDAQNKFVLPARTLVGITEQWRSNNGNTSVTAWVKNLANEKYDLSYSLLTPVGLVGNPAAPRTYGLTIGQKF